MKRILINTGGGDAPGLNAVIYAVVHTAERLGWETYGIRDGTGFVRPMRALIAEKQFFSEWLSGYASSEPT